jgi:hypothetical protein
MKMESIIKKSVKIATNDRNADLYRTKKGYFMACYPTFPGKAWIAWLDEIEAKDSYDEMEKIEDFLWD